MGGKEEAESRAALSGVYVPSRGQPHRGCGGRDRTQGQQSGELGGDLPRRPQTISPPAPGQPSSAPPATPLLPVPAGAHGAALLSQAPTSRGTCSTRLTWAGPRLQSGAIVFKNSFLVLKKTLRIICFLLIRFLETRKTIPTPAQNPGFSPTLTQNTPSTFPH